MIASPQAGMVALLLEKALAFCMHGSQSAVIPDFKAARYNIFNKLGQRVLASARNSTTCSSDPDGKRIAFQQK